MAEPLKKPDRRMEKCDCRGACSESHEDDPERRIARLELVRKELQQRIGQLLKVR